MIVARLIIVLLWVCGCKSRETPKALDLGFYLKLPRVSIVVAFFG